MVEIDLAAIRHNVRMLTPDAAEVMAVVKAEGYGHGAIQVALSALEAGATWLAVAIVEEGIALRQAGLECPILVLSEFPRGSERDALAAGLTPALYTPEGVAAVRAAAGAGARPGAHVKIDTGMHRVGLPPEQTLRFVRELTLSGLRLEGLWTHLAKAEEPEDPSVTLQLDRFRRVCEELSALGFQPRYRHAANSAAILALPTAHFDLVRLGLSMYGLPPNPALPRASQLRPAMSWRSAVAFVKRVPAGEGISYGLRYRLLRASTVATVPVGYADGYGRSLSDRARVLIRGRRYPIAGTVTMDQVMVDCGDDEVSAGDEVVLLGRQGEQVITADEMAVWMETVNYEVVTRVGPRVPREYVDSRREGRRS